MAEVHWDNAFAALLREHLHLTEDAAELSPDDDLRLLGLDSVGTVALILELEEHYRVEFTAEALTASAWSTPASLWETLRSLLG